MSKRKLAIFPKLALGVLCLLSFLAAGAPFGHAEDIVAIVNEEVITQKDLDDFSNFMRMELQQNFQGQELEDKLATMKPDMLNKLIEDRLILQEAKKEKIKVDEGRIKERVNDLKRRYPAEADFLAALSAQGLTLADIEIRLREQLLAYLMIEAKIKSAITVSPAEVTDYYQEYRSEFLLPEQREFEVIKISDEKLAKKIASELQIGLDYGVSDQDAALVQLNKVRAYKGRELRKEIEEAVFALKENGASDPIKLDDGYYIFRVLQIIPSREEGLSESRARIHALLSNKKMQESLSKWLAEIKGRSYIKIIPS